MTEEAIQNPKPKISGAIPLQVSEEDAARLVGGIVEKGFSNNQQSRSFGPPAPPRPAVLPFPVARHRSHGPHWAPKVENFNVVNEEDDDDDIGEEKDWDEMESVARVANPVSRKEKRGLDFSRWQEMVENDHGLVHHEKKRERHGTASENDHKAMEISEPSLVLSKERESNSTMQKSRVVSGFAEEKLDGSLESQIDSENLARLAKMSDDEIAEAQAEIMAKLNPELIKALKKRGQDKVRKQERKLVGGDETQIDSENRARLAEVSADEIAEVTEKLNLELVKDLKKSGQDKVGKQEQSLLDNPSSEANNTLSDEQVKTVTGNATKDEYLENTSQTKSNAWDAWSKRVEGVRDMRFSLDGNIINTDFVHASDTGDGSSKSGYNLDNVSERDFLRTEGDPGAVGYTIKEAVALTRSVVPGQRALALHLIAAILDRAIRTICQSQVGDAANTADAVGSVDWEAIWAFALGPEPELSLTLRMSLDDNHNSVVLACAKAIHCVLSCEMNDTVFDISEKTPTYAGDICTAPVFRSKPDVNAGFLHGGFWKYNTKPSNILHLGEESTGDKDEDKRTIQDDVVVAGQDVAAGLVRMGILPRICYLMETDPSAPLEEYMISILIAISRHSPTCAAAVIDCGKLVQTIASRFASKEQTGINACKIKSVRLINVLAQAEKKNCLAFIKNGILRQMTWHLFRHPFPMDQWVKSGKESCKLSSSLSVEQLRLWKVFIRYGYCVSDFPDLFASLCFWLSLPDFERLIDNNVINEHCAVTKEAYLLLDVLAGKLPNFYSPEENSLWLQFGSVVDQSLEWIAVKRNPHVSGIFQNRGGDSEITSLLWVISSVLKMLSTMLKAVIPDNPASFRLPWLPDFIPKVGLEIIKNGYLRFSGVTDFSENGSVVKYLNDLRLKKGPEVAISSVCCLQGLVQVISTIDELIQRANLDIHNPEFNQHHLSSEDKILANGMVKSSAVELRDLLTTLTTLIANEWEDMQYVETFNRGGPAPGVGVGWGASGGGYWSLHALLAQQDVTLLVYLLEMTEMPSVEVPVMLNCVLSACLIVGPGNSPVLGKLLKFIFDVPVLKKLDFGIRQFVCFGWNYGEEEFRLFADVLATHFRNRWLSVKKKRKAPEHTLETIHEDSDGHGEKTSLKPEWAYQRLPLPPHWFLSAISEEISMSPDISKAGLFFLLGLESFHTIESIPVVWKLHAMSVSLLPGMSVLHDEKSRDVFETLQKVYGKTINENGISSLKFEMDINENYATFIEKLVEQFAAESYGDVLFGRQVAVYLHKSVEAPVRLAMWNALSNVRALELLPPLPECFSAAEGFLEPIEDDERILESYVKSWVSGALDKAATRNSMAFSVALHHLSFFIFGNAMGSAVWLRNKLVKSLVRDYGRKQQQHEGMMVRLVCYQKPETTSHQGVALSSEIERRLQLLKDVGDGNATLVKRLESRLLRERS